MPSAKLFRCFIISDKTSIKISALHLFNDNQRVDQTATITTAVMQAAGSLSYLKNDTSVEGQFFGINDTTQIRKTTLYITWSFSTAVNVNAFRVGSCDDEETFLDQFHLQYSDDNGLTYTNFISIGKDKKLSYPGPWQLSLLKPVGECFPLVLSQEQYVFQNTIGFSTNIGSDGRSFTSFDKLESLVVTDLNYSNTNRTFVDIPGFYSTGKYYFETSRFFNSKQLISGNGNGIFLYFIPDDTEKMNYATTHSNQRFAFCLTNLFTRHSTSLNSYSYTNNTGGGTLSTVFAPGYQSGFTIDFDSRQLRFYNTKYRTPQATINLTQANTDMALYPVGTKYKLYFISDRFCLMPNIYLNVGQDTFFNEVPSGFQPGLGPRWKEEVVTTSIKFNGKNSSRNNEFLPYDFPVNVVSFVESPLIINEVGGGVFYIKGKVTRVPELYTKRLVVSCYSVNYRRIIQHCRVSDQGTYEFLNLANGPYILTSIDTTNNTFVESIGPVYPKEMVL